MLDKAVFHRRICKVRTKRLETESLLSAWSLSWEVSRESCVETWSESLPPLKWRQRRRKELISNSISLHCIANLIVPVHSHNYAGRDHCLVFSRSWPFWALNDVPHHDEKGGAGYFILHSCILSLTNSNRGWKIRRLKSVRVGVWSWFFGMVCFVKDLKNVLKLK